MHSYLGGLTLKIDLDGNCLKPQRQASSQWGPYHACTAKFFLKVSWLFVYKWLTLWIPAQALV